MALELQVGQIILRTNALTSSGRTDLALNRFLLGVTLRVREVHDGGSIVVEVLATPTGHPSVGSVYSIPGYALKEEFFKFV